MRKLSPRLLSFFRLRAINRKTTFQDSFPFEKKREKKKREEKEIMGKEKGKEKRSKEKEKGVFSFHLLLRLW